MIFTIGEEEYNEGKANFIEQWKWIAKQTDKKADDITIKYKFPQFILSCWPCYISIHCIPTKGKSLGCIACPVKLINKQLLCYTFYWDWKYSEGKQASMFAKLIASTEWFTYDEWKNRCLKASNEVEEKKETFDVSEEELKNEN
jgi:hypothetical protein